MTIKYQVCTRCVMDTSASDIIFDNYGVCNYCTQYLKDSDHILTKDKTIRKDKLNKFVEIVKKAGARKKYDCIIGVSGGVDSSWVLLQAVKLGLRPLAVHMDNGWNSELAQNNISNLVQELKVDLYTHVIDWQEYRKLMQAFFDADVVDVELLYDNAMLAVNYQQAAKYGVKFILAGTNHSTEGMPFPIGWNWNKFDKTNIESIAKTFGNLQLKTFPSISVLEYVWYEYVKRSKWISFLDFFDYNKNEALSILSQNYNYKPYPYKHYESVFTRFYQGYILPEKFKIDKRRIHLSALVASNQMSRDAALELLKQIPYPSEIELENDKNYFLKKMNLSEDQLQNYLSRPGKPHSIYPSERNRWNFFFVDSNNRFIYKTLKNLYYFIKNK